MTVSPGRMTRGPAQVEGGKGPGSRPLNLRDLGGHRVIGGGRVRIGQVYRSAEPPDGSHEALAALNLRAVYDLRSEAEREARPDRLPPGVELVVADILADAPDGSPAGFSRLLEDPAAASRVLGDGGAERFFVDRYREFVTLGSARRGYQRLFLGMADGSARPCLFHCATGKDRTGWAAAALLLLLGVPEDDVMADFLTLDPALDQLFRPLRRAFADRGGDPAVLVPLVGVRPAYLRSALDTVRAEFGSIEGWFTDGLGLGPDVQQALRAGLVAPA